jgi:hypothetical protein
MQQREGGYGAFSLYDLKLVVLLAGECKPRTLPNTRMQPDAAARPQDQGDFGMWDRFKSRIDLQLRRLKREALGCSLYSARIHTHYRSSLTSSNSLILTKRTMNGGFA